MNFNFELILFYASVVTGLIYLFDVLFLAKKREKAKVDMPLIIDYARAFFPVLILVFLLRSFLYEPFRIPSPSLEPTLLRGDFILVNKFDYGIRLPVIHKKLVEIDQPKRGDIIVFRWPPNPSVNFIKRVIGVPGDRLSYVKKILYVNGQPLSQSAIGVRTIAEEGRSSWQAEEKQEDLLGTKHHIYIDPARSGSDFKDIIVPPNMYFVMGDNRDDSADSRFWGFVPEENIIGKGVLIWMSWAGLDNGIIRWSRIGGRIH